MFLNIMEYIAQKSKIMGANKQLQRRGATVYRLAGFIRWAAFKFLALTTSIFIWVSFYGYFSQKVGDIVAPALGVIAVVIMFFLIDKGLESLIEFIADERLSPSASEGPDGVKARQRFVNWVAIITVVRLLATGTTSIWGSFEIAEFVTDKPDGTAIVQQMSSENQTLETARNSLSKQLETARKTEGNRVKQAKRDGHAAVNAAVAKHPRPEVQDGVRNMRGWYSTTPKLRKYRDGVNAAKADSARMVSQEIASVKTLEAQLVALETDGLKAANDIKSKLADLAAAMGRDYEVTKARRGNFLIVVDFLAVIFGLIAVWIRATYRAAVGQESELEERTLEGILWAAIRQYSNAFLAWLEGVLRIDVDGNGVIGTVGETPVSELVPSAETGGSSSGIPGLPPGLEPVSDRGVSVVAQGSQKILVDVSLLKKATRKQWERAYTSKEAAARAENRRKALQGQKELEKLGYTVTRWVEKLSNGKEIGRMKITIGDGEEVN